MKYLSKNNLAIIAGVEMNRRGAGRANLVCQINRKLFAIRYEMVDDTAQEVERVLMDKGECILLSDTHFDALNKRLKRRVQE